MVGPYFSVDVIWATSCPAMFLGWWDGMEICLLTPCHFLLCFLVGGTGRQPISRSWFDLARGCLVGFTMVTWRPSSDRLGNVLSFSHPLKESSLGRITSAARGRSLPVRLSCLGARGLSQVRYGESIGIGFATERSRPYRHRTGRDLVDMGLIET
ncbi:hypothetical protein GW17_00019929 [Ensete ventricosum]|nr:hypothetical protein GW17_00019929 [Ensete ventricosum]